MSEDWSAAAADIAAGLAEVGAPANLVRTTTTGGDGTPFNPGTPTEVLTPVTAFETEFTRQELDGGSVRTGDVKLMTTVPASGALLTQAIRWGGRDYQIIRADRLAPNGSVVLALMWHLRP